MKRGLLKAQGLGMFPKLAGQSCTYEENMRNENITRIQEDKMNFLSTILCVRWAQTPSLCEY